MLACARSCSRVLARVSGFTELSAIDARAPSPARCPAVHAGRGRLSLVAARTGADSRPLRPTPAAARARVVLTWRDDPARTQAVTWRTDALVEEAFAEIAEASANPGFAALARRSPARTTAVPVPTGTAYYHEARFTALRPNTPATPIASATARPGASGSTSAPPPSSRALLVHLPGRRPERHPLALVPRHPRGVHRRAARPLRAARRRPGQRRRERRPVGRVVRRRQLDQRHGGAGAGGGQPRVRASRHARTRRSCPPSGGRSSRCPRTAPRVSPRPPTRSTTRARGSSC